MTGLRNRTGRGSMARRTRRATAGKGRATSTTTAVSSPGEEALAMHLTVNKIDFQRAVQCIPGRKWRVDFLLGENLVIEIEGAVHRIKGRFARDLEKYNALTIAGYAVLRFNTKMVTSGKAIETITQLVKETSNG